MADPNVADDDGRENRVSDRGLQVLRYIVSDYIEHREPVGSKSIASRYPFGVSAATIRNEMAQLEDAELIVAPHTSSGRVPTDKGYRVFVDRLAEIRPLTRAQRNAIRRMLEQEAGDYDATLEQAVRTLASLTRSVAVLQVPSLAAASIRHLEFVRLAPRRMLTVVITDAGRVEQRVSELPEPIGDELLDALRDQLAPRLIGKSVGDAVRELRDVSDVVEPRHADVVAPIVANLIDQVLANTQERLIMAGAANLARTERDFPSTITPVLEAIEEQVVLLRLLGNMSLDERDLGVRIGREHDEEALAETSLVASGFEHDGGESRIGIIGPTRMDYPRNISAVRAVARYLSSLFEDDGNDDEQREPRM